MAECGQQYVMFKGGSPKHNKKPVLLKMICLKCNGLPTNPKILMYKTVTVNDIL